MKINKNNNKGFTAVEMVIYTAILAMIFVVIVNTILTISKSFNAFSVTNDINNSAVTFLERFVRETRQANSINLSQSILGVNPGKLVLTSVDDFGVSETIEFSVSDGKIVLYKDGVSLGSLITKNASTTSLIFKNITASSSSLIRVEVVFEASRGNVTRSENFYTSSVLRGAY